MPQPPARTRAGRAQQGQRGPPPELLQREQADPGIRANRRPGRLRVVAPGGEEEATSSRSGCVVTCWSVSRRSSTKASRGRLPCSAFQAAISARRFRHLCTPVSLPCTSASRTSQWSRMRRANSPSLVVTSTLREGSATRRRSSSTLPYGAWSAIQPASSAAIHSRRTSSSAWPRRAISASPAATPPRRAPRAPAPVAQDLRAWDPVRDGAQEHRHLPAAQDHRAQRAERHEGAVGGRLVSGHTCGQVRRLVSKYSRRPSQQTPSKSSARMSGIVMAGHRTDANRAEEGAPPPHKRPTFQPSTAGLPLAPSRRSWPHWSATSARGRRPARAACRRWTSGSWGLEDEATRLRAEVAALQDEIRWLTGQDEEPAGWLSRGWVRASLLLTAVGMISLVPLPYLLNLDTPGPHADPAPPRVPAPGPDRAPARPPPQAAARDAPPARPASPRPRFPSPRVPVRGRPPGAAPRPRPPRAPRAPAVGRHRRLARARREPLGRAGPRKRPAHTDSAATPAAVAASGTRSRSSPSRRRSARPATRPARCRARSPPGWPRRSSRSAVRGSGRSSWRAR